MAREASTNELLLGAVNAIKSSDVLQCRTELISKLSDLKISEKCDLCFLIENLIVASKYVVTDRYGCIHTQLMTLGSKASLWSRKHLKMTIMSMEESQEEEHSNTFYQLLLDVLNFSAASFPALNCSFTLEERVLMDILENFILELLDLIKVSLEHVKKLESHGAEVLKVSQLVIDSIIRFCSEQCQEKQWDNFAECLEDGKGSIASEGSIRVNPVINIRKCIIQKLCDLGILASKDGGHLVSILNTSWKGVVTLLQQGKGSLEAVLNVSDIILKLISLANYCLKSAAESWLPSTKEPISVAVARRTFVPVKFYLVNVAKISSLCPGQAFHVHQEITLCALMISYFRISLTKEKNLKVANEVLSELLEQVSMSLFYSILNSDEVKEEMKFEILNSLFTEDSHDSSYEESFGKATMQIEKIFPVTCEGIPCENALSVGRILLFICLLRSSINVEEHVKLQITRKLGWLFNMLVQEAAYASLLSLQIPLSYVNGQKTEIIWEPMFSSLLESLKTFMIAASSGVVWGEIMAFLLDNIFHPHLLCWEIIMELLCFLMRFGENHVASNIIDKLCSCFKSVVRFGSILDPGPLARKIARLISLLVKYGAQSQADRVYSFIFDGDESLLSSVMLVALLMEGFSLQMLSDNFKEIARKRIITDYCDFIGNSRGRLLEAGSFILSGAPVFALAASLPLIQQFNESDIDKETLELLSAIIGALSESADPKTLDNCHRLLAETLWIISNMKDFYISNEVEEIIPKLHSLFISKTSGSNTHQQRSKAELALFMAGLSHMEISETEECEKSNALRGLYHMLLRERHWALIHLAIASFGYFAARTSCSQLWRFVPEDAALSYDLITGNKVSEERFMCEFKAFLEKEMAMPEIAPSAEQLLLLREEAAWLKEAAQKKMENNETEEMDCEVMEIDCEQVSSKRRKMPDGISKGVEMLQSGLRVIGEGLSHWQKVQPDSPDLQDKFLTHFSCLESVIADLASITSSGSS